MSTNTLTLLCLFTCSEIHIAYMNFGAYKLLYLINGNVPMMPHSVSLLYVLILFGSVIIYLHKYVVTCTHTHTHILYYIRSRFPIIYQCAIVQLYRPHWCGSLSVDLFANFSVDLSVDLTVDKSVEVDTYFLPGALEMLKWQWIVTNSFVQT